MTKDKKPDFTIVICACCAISVSAFLAGIRLGMNLSHGMIQERLEKAGVQKLILHKTVVDQVTTTNWLEIVWKKDIKK